MVSSHRSTFIYCILTLVTSPSSFFRCTFPFLSFFPSFLLPSELRRVHRRRRGEHHRGRPHRCDQDTDPEPTLQRPQGKKRRSVGPRGPLCVRCVRACDVNVNAYSRVTSYMNITNQVHLSLFETISFYSKPIKLLTHRAALR